MDYELLQSTNPEFNKAIVRVNIFRSHRQTIQYIHPQDYSKLGQAELVVIDEAAAIPLPYVQKLLGPYLVFMASTVNGYSFLAELHLSCGGCSSIIFFPAAVMKALGARSRLS